IGVAIFDELGDLVPTKPENDAVFVVVAFATLCEDIATYLGDHKITFCDEVYSLRPVLSGEQSKKWLKQACAYGILPLEVPGPARTSCQTPDIVGMDGGTECLEIAALQGRIDSADGLLVLINVHCDLRR